MITTEKANDSEPINRRYLDNHGHTVEVRRTRSGYAARILLENPLWGSWKSATFEEAQRKLDEYAAKNGWRVRNDANT